jgi:hypothetical protein
MIESIQPDAPWRSILHQLPETQVICDACGIIPCIEVYLHKCLIACNEYDCENCEGCIFQTCENKHLILIREVDAL